MAKVQIESPIHIVTSENTPTVETLPLGHVAFKNEVGGSRVYIHGSRGIEESIAFKNVSFFYDFKDIIYNVANIIVHFRTKSISGGAFSTDKMQIDAATATSAGVMSAADKAKLDSLSTSNGSGDGKMQISLRKERIYNQELLQEWYENIELFNRQDWGRPLIPKEAASWKFYVDGIDDYNTYCLALFTEKNTVQRYRTHPKSIRKRRRSVKLIAHGDHEDISNFFVYFQDEAHVGLTQNDTLDFPEASSVSPFNKNNYPRKVEKKYYLCVLAKNLFKDLGGYQNYKVIVNEFGVEKPSPITLEDAVSNVIEITLRYSTSIVDGQTVWTGNVIF